MSWIIWLIIIIILLPGFFLGLRFVPFAFDNPYGNPLIQCLVAILIPLWVAVLVPIWALISLIYWIFGIY